MKKQKLITTAYELPFEVRYSSGLLFSSGGTVSAVANLSRRLTGGPKTLTEVIRLFARLAATGALAGSAVEPWNSGLQLGPPAGDTHFQLVNCRVDEQALIVLAHLLLARQEDILLKSLEVSICGEQATHRLEHDPIELSMYPEAYPSLPFSLVDEEPESGAYTFVAELKQPLQAQHGEYLENALKRWTESILAGGYGLAPIPPQESYVEPDDDCVTSFGTTIEWTVFKLRADPACVQCLINIFAAFHHRCQEIVSLTVT